MGDFKSIWRDLQGVPFEQGYIDVDGCRTRYLHAGSREKPTLVLLHGSAGHAEAYVRNLQAHSPHFSTWAIDMLGHGYTDRPGHPLEVRHYAAHLTKFLNTIDVEQAHISGESLGGWVATRLAIDEPQRVARLVLNTTGGSQADPDVMRRIRVLSMAAAENPDWENVGARIRWLMADKAGNYDDIIASRQTIYQTPGFIDAMSDILALQDPEIRGRNIITAEEYRSIQAPTLVLWTSDDPTADVSEGRRIASMIPGARFTVMEDCGHWPQYENPDDFNRIHIGFLLGDS